MRTYSISFAGVTVAAVQDLIGLYCGASMGAELHGFVLGQITGTAVQNLRLSVKRLAATVTPGTAGTTPTPQKMERGSAAATVTARANDTGQATSAGVALLHADVYNTVNGYQFFWPVADRPSAGLNEALILSLDTAPSSMVMSGSLYFAERL